MFLLRCLHSPVCAVEVTNVAATTLQHMATGRLLDPAVEAEGRLEEGGLRHPTDNAAALRFNLRSGGDWHSHSRAPRV